MLYGVNIHYLYIYTRTSCDVKKNNTKYIHFMYAHGAYFEYTI